MGNNLSTVWDIALKFCVYVPCGERNSGIAFGVTEVKVKVTDIKMGNNLSTVWDIALKFCVYVPYGERKSGIAFGGGAVVGVAMVTIYRKTVSGL